MDVEKKKSRSAWLAWRLSPEELEKQVREYKTLKFTESYRGITVIAIAVIISISAAFAAFGIIKWIDLIGDVILYVPVTFFAYRGHRWAFIALIVLWTLDKGAQFVLMASAGQGFISPIIWWFIFVPLFWKGFTVERIRRKHSVLPDTTAST